MDEAPPIGEPGLTTTVWTVGHATRPIAEFLDVLRAHGISTLVDVRAIPASRRNPQFGRDALARAAEGAALRYVWMGDSLGGLRRPRPDSPHAALRVEGFRGYADHMTTPAFREGLDALLALAREGSTAAMCAETVWWRCHRSILADHLTLVRDVRVFHILDAGPAKPHESRPEARLDGDVLVYDRRVSRDEGTRGGGAPASREAPGLFADAPPAEREAGADARPRATERPAG